MNHVHEDSSTAEEFWDGRYGSGDRIWSGEPNASLVREAAGLTPGRALDLGCGEGDDAIWLARQGWRVTGVDISRVALDRAAGHAADAGVPDLIEWQRHDLAESFPKGEYDLVSAHFLHSPVELPRGAILRAAADAVAPGGVLLIVGHAGQPSWVTEPVHHLDFPTAEDVLADLALPEADWEVLHTDVHERAMTAPDGTAGSRTDTTVKVRRRP